MDCKVARHTAAAWTVNFSCFFLGIPVVCSLLLLWFISPLKLTLGKIFFKQNFLSLEQFDDFLFIKAPILGKLLSCWICCSFWLSLAVGLFSVVLLDQPLWYPILTFLTYPSLCYLFKATIKH
jgi:hypothetical protein